MEHVYLSKLSSIAKLMLQKSDVLIRYGVVKGGRIGIKVPDGTYIQDGAGEGKGGRPMSALQR
jgi:hypothetical protein